MRSKLARSPASAANPYSGLTSASTEIIFVVTNAPLIKAVAIMASRISVSLRLVMNFFFRQNPSRNLKRGIPRSVIYTRLRASIPSAAMYRRSGGSMGVDAEKEKLRKSRSSFSEYSFSIVTGTPGFDNPVNQEIATRTSRSNSGLPGDKFVAPSIAE
jgi:hypothetical protein